MKKRSLRIGKWLIAAAAFGFLSAFAIPQTLFNPVSQINWPKATGSSPASSITCQATYTGPGTAGYGTPYTQTAISGSQVYSICTPQGWYQIASTTLGSCSVDSNGNLTCPGAFISGQGGQGYDAWNCGAATIPATGVTLPTNYSGMTAPPSCAIHVLLQMPATAMTEPDFLSWGVPSTVEGVLQSAATRVPTWDVPLPCADTSGSGTAQSCTTAPSYTPAAPVCMLYTTTTPNSGTGLTINWNGLGAKSVAVPSSTGWSTTLSTSPASVPANTPMLGCYDGTKINLSMTGNQAAGGGSLDVGGSPVASPNLSSTTPSAPGGNTNCTWQVSGSDVSCYVPSSGGSSPSIVPCPNCTTNGTSTTITDVAGQYLLFFTINVGTPTSSLGNTFSLLYNGGSGNCGAAQLYGAPVTTGGSDLISGAGHAFSMLILANFPASPFDAANAFCFTATGSSTVDNQTFNVTTTQVSDMIIQLQNIQGSGGNCAFTSPAGWSLSQLYTTSSGTFTRYIASTYIQEPQAGFLQASWTDACAFGNSGFAGLVALKTF